MSDITVVLPNWNKVAFLEPCLESLLGQTLGDFKCVIVDGKSTDGSLDVIQRYIARDRRLSLRADPGRGLYAAWNSGLSEVQTPFFSILTSDDTWPLNFLETMLSTLKGNPEAIASAARVRIIEASGRPGEIAIHNRMGEAFFGTKDTEIRPVVANAIATYFLGPINTSIHAFLFRFSVLESIGSFSESFGSAGDYEFYLRLAELGPLAYEPGLEVGWRVYEGQATDPLAQEQNGQISRAIHDSRRRSLAALPRMPETFEREALRYDRSVLHFHFQRPALRNLRIHPVRSGLRLIKTAFSHPVALGLDLLASVRKQEGFFIQASAHAAKHMAKQCAI